MPKRPGELGPIPNVPTIQAEVSPYWPGPRYFIHHRDANRFVGWDWEQARHQLLLLGIEDLTQREALLELAATEPLLGTPIGFDGEPVPEGTNV